MNNEEGYSQALQDGTHHGNLFYFLQLIEDEVKKGKHTAKAGYADGVFWAAMR